MLVAEDPISSGRHSVASCADLVALLRTQHHELRTLMARVPRLRGEARQDVFLQVRRRLAVHEALERFLVTPRAGEAAADEYLHLHQEVWAAERAEPDSAEFDSAYARMAIAHLNHAQVQEDAVFGRLDGELSRAEQSVVAAADRLWAGEGEHYLGNGYLAMVATAHEELTAATAP